MIKNGIKNYFKNLKHFFTPIGTLAAGLFIGLSILIPGTLAIISELIDKLAGIINDATFDFSELGDAISGAVRALDWSDPVASLKTVLSLEWLKGVVDECLSVISGGLQPYAEAIGEAVGAAMAGIYFLFILLILFAIIGLVCGYFLTRFLVRRNMAKRTFKKYLLASVVDSFVTATLISVSFWLLTLWAPSIMITSIMSLIIFACTALVSAYLVHGKGKVQFKDVFNGKNLFKLLFVNAITFLISIVFLILTILITNLIAGILIGFSFVEIAFLVMSMNAESFVINLASERTLPSTEFVTDMQTDETAAPVEGQTEKTVEGESTENDLSDAV